MSSKKRKNSFTTVHHVYLSRWQSGELSSQASEMLYSPPGAVNILNVMVVYHFPKNSGNFGWDVNGKTVLVCPNGNFPK